MPGDSESNVAERSASWRWLDARTGLGELLDRRLPAGSLRWCAFGPWLALLITVQVVTGILLLFYFNPHTDSAFESVQHLMLDVRGGWIVRLFHAHAASLLIALVVLRVSWSALRGFYRAPRQLSWYLTVVLLLTVLASGITGYTLPWSQVSYWGATIVTASLEAAPLVGGELLWLARGGELVAQSTLTRVFAVHVAVLAPLLVLLGAFYLRVRRREEALAGAPLESEPFFPAAVVRLSVRLVLLLAALLGLAIIAPNLFFSPGHDVPANPYATPEGIKPEWYMLWAYQLTRLVTDRVSLLLQGFVVAALLVLPLLDRSHPEQRCGRLWIVVLVTAGLLTLVGLSAGGAMAAATEESTCVMCHEHEEDAELVDPVHEWRESSHAAASVSCDACHGGDPFEEDADASMSEEAGFLDNPSWSEMSGYCGECHEEIAAAFDAGALGARIRAGERAPSCGDCHMGNGHRTVAASERDLKLGSRCRSCEPASLLEAEVWASSLRGTLDAEDGLERAIEFLETRALPTHDLDRELGLARDHYAVTLHSFEAYTLGPAQEGWHRTMAGMQQELERRSDKARQRRHFGLVVLPCLLGAALALHWFGGRAS